MEHIHVINQVIEKSAVYNQTLYIAFIDYEKALDSVEILAVIEALSILGNIYNGSTATLVLHNKNGTLPIRKGVRQGGTISPMLFTACLEEIFKPLDWADLGVRIDSEYLSNLRFADCIYTGDELQQMIEYLIRESVRVGLKINTHKTKKVFNSLEREQQSRIAREPLESLQEYIYVGQLLTADPDHEKET